MYINHNCWIAGMWFQSPCSRRAALIYINNPPTIVHVLLEFHTVNVQSLVGYRWKSLTVYSLVLGYSLDPSTVHSQRVQDSGLSLPK